MVDHAVDEGTVHERMNDLHPHVLVVTIDRAPVNAMTMPMYTRLYEIFEGLTGTAFKLANKLAAKSPKLMRMRKESMDVVAEMPFAAGYRVEQLYTAMAVSLADGREASASVAEKRAPRWKDDQPEVNK